MCNQLLIDAIEFDCGHRYCKSCAITLFESQKDEKSCMVCSQCLTKNPTRKHALDNLLETQISTFPKFEIASWEQRTVESNRQKEAKLKIINEQINNFIRYGVMPLSLEYTWTQAEVTSVASGIKRVTDEARVQFCQLMGLSPLWIMKATTAELNIASHNLRITATNEIDMREQLMDIADGDTITLCCN
jgi:uncharacterized UBP type Zn finger protein